MFVGQVFRERADDINAQGIFLGIFKGPGDKFEREPFAALCLRDLCMPDRHPALTIGLEFQVADLPILFDLEPASSNFG